MTELVWKHLSIPFGVILLLMKCNKREKKKWCHNESEPVAGTVDMNEEPHMFLIVSFQDGGDVARLQKKKKKKRPSLAIQSASDGFGKVHR